MRFSLEIPRPALGVAVRVFPGGDGDGGGCRAREARDQKFSRGLSRLSLLRTLTSSALPPLLLSSTDLWTSKADGTEKESVWVMTRSLFCPAASSATKISWSPFFFKLDRISLESEPENLIKLNATFY